MTFGALVRQLLREKGMTQNELARRTGLPSPHINMICNEKVRRPTIENAFLIADALDVDVNTFRQCFDSEEG